MLIYYSKKFSEDFQSIVHNRILLIGLGPHSKRIYIGGLRRFGLEPCLIIDVESKKADIEAYVKTHDLKSQLYFVPDHQRDLLHLTQSVQDHLDALIDVLNITHAIISTEPKAHFAYLEYLITKKVRTLTDKPITAPVDVINDENQAYKIKQEYEKLIFLADLYQTPVYVQCQRRYDRRYRWIKEKLDHLIKQYDIPVSHLHITHCDGTWNMPNEFFSRENHPYKYGYGKLFHSGYHFIDLAAFLLSYEDLSPHKHPTECMILSTQYGPHDQLLSLDQGFYQKAFNKESLFSASYDLWEQGKCAQMGELDFFSLLEFTRGSHVITSCSLNLLQSGFSRRGWTELPIDNYKGNGRVRHETVSIQLGPLMNIQVHSYQAHEIKERENKNIDQQGPGGLEHFDIHIFRNSDILGGPAHEMIKGSDLFSLTTNEELGFIGYNEYARHECLSDFLFRKKGLSLLSDQKLTIDLVTNAYVALCRKRQKEAPVSKFTLIENKQEKESSYATAEFHSSLYSR